MKLKQYLSKKKITATQFAAQIGVSAHTVQRYFTSRVPERDIMLAIYKVTRGAVVPNDFYPLKKPRARSKK